MFSDHTTVQDKTKLLEDFEGKQFVNKTFKDVLKPNNVKRCSRYKSKK